MKKIVAICGLVLTLTACADEEITAPVQFVRPMAPKMMINVKTINLTDRSNTTATNTLYKNNNFNPTIAEAIKQWAGDRLQAVGPSGQAMVVVKDASLTSQTLFTSDSIDSWFTRQQGLKYTGHAEISLEATGTPGFAMAEASVTRSVTLPEHPSAAERQDAYYTLLNGLMKDLGQNMDASIQAHMGDFLAAAPIYGNSTIAVHMPSTVPADLPTAAPTPLMDSEKQPMMVTPFNGTVTAPHQVIEIPLSDSAR